MSHESRKDKRIKIKNVQNTKERKKKQNVGHMGEIYTSSNENQETTVMLKFC